MKSAKGFPAVWFLFKIALSWRSASCLAVLWALISSAPAALPTYDHVVVVVEENEGFQQVLGSGAAPYIDSLAKGGVSFTNMRSITHPSQPNYLEFFSGDNQGIADDSRPVGMPFSTPNLGAALLAAGQTFVAYSESLPAAGDITTESQSPYSRRHCPWTSWMKTGTLGPNQLSPSLHQPFTAFPTDFTTLPRVAFVIPNNANNMHDFGVASGNLWLSQKMSAYATWAKTHNSLLIVIWDEDNFQIANRIPTIFYGANLRDGTLNAGSWTIHNVLRTLEELFGLTHSGRAAEVRPITGAFAGEWPVGTHIFRNGLDGYAGNHDTSISEAAPANASGTITPLSAVGGTGTRVQDLTRFDNLFGSAASQLPANVNIVSAKLLLVTSADSTGQMRLHRMLSPWTEASTWNSLDNGIGTDDSEALTLAESTAVPNGEFGYVSVTTFDVTGSAFAWQSGTENDGWTVQTTSSDSWSFSSAEAASNPPSLEISFTGSALSFAASTASVSEQAGFIDIVVLRTGELSGTASVDYATYDGTATAGSDYTATNGTLSWSAGDAASRTIRIPILADSTGESDEFFVIYLTHPLGLAMIDRIGSVPVTIVETPFDKWRKTKFGTNLSDPAAATDADPDGDGISNLLEYAYNSEPKLAKASVSPTLSGTSYVTVTFARNASATDLTYTVQASGDLQTWANGSVYSAAGSIPTNAVTTELSHSTGPTETIAVRDNTPASSGNPRFLRLRVTRQ